MQGTDCYTDRSNPRAGPFIWPARRTLCLTNLTRGTERSAGRALSANPPASAYKEVALPKRTGGCNELEPYGEAQLLYVTKRDDMEIAAAIN